MKFSRLVFAVAAATSIVAAGMMTATLAEQSGRSRVQQVAGSATPGTPPRAGRAVSAPAAGPAGAASGDAPIALVTAQLLARQHYLQRPLDDALSSRLLDRFLDTLDPQRVSFLQSDVEAFEPLRTTLDDRTAQRGDTAPARQIFSRFLERVDAQVAYAQEALQSETFAFAGNETYLLERENQPRPRDLEEAKQLWRDRLRYEYLQEKLNKSKPADIVTTLNRRYTRLARTLHEYDDDDIFELYLTTLTRVYDPHSGYFGRASSENFDISMRLSLVGIGAQLLSEDGYAKIMELIPGGPAAKSGRLKPGDRIVAVAQGGAEPVDVVDMKIDKVVQLIRGPKGTPVSLTVIPADAPDPSTRTTISLLRDEIKLEEQAAKAQVIEVPSGKKAVRLGVVDLPSFYYDPNTKRSATGDVARLLGRLKKEKVAGVILDLRRNGGGALPEAISLTGLFIKDGPVVQVRDSGGEVEVARDTDPSVAYDGPLIVLISRFSASASEIVAGALQDYGRALIVGDTSTFGKGTVQAVIDLAPILQRAGLGGGGAQNPGSLHLTIQKFYRPGGASTQLKGVVPEIVLPSPSSVLDVGERTLDNPLPWDTIRTAQYRKVNRVQPYLAPLRKRSATRLAGDRDFAFLRQEIAQIRKTVQQKRVSLNEQQRMRERQAAVARSEARKKEMRSRPAPKEKVFALALRDVNAPTLPKPAPPPVPRAAAGTSTSSEGDAIAGTGISVGRDVALDETKRILMDWITLSARPR